MIPDVFISRTGARESLNADHVEHWPIEGGHAYLVCDGIDHIEHTATIVRLFSSLLKAADWGYSESPEAQLASNVLAVMDTISQNDQGTAFCLGIALVTADKMIIGHCGDCRIGLLRDNGIEWLTEDDVPFFSMYKKGLLTKETYLRCRHIPSCKMKTGEKNSQKLKTATLPRPASKRLLLCSDGFWSECEDLLTGSHEICLQAIRQLNSSLLTTAQDNFSIIVV
ncbi:PP2C family serine/threonine-protein phosphatase [Endozoicomonas sp. SCSIO W0465]|uniref:PP2C family protein-serine/threonine phosphatase n=1 Tax=Endozoicomonas sp. SCSIO W0465 TaxID=2918516 RepID=UPI002075B7E0|nr:hypothetical protein [Endozoicomonas sp. SCSIO W0465]USE36828.1 hypothetical protein MJO57_00875 [Endozoicomonas sp. SCSIO W0465]